MKKSTLPGRQQGYAAENQNKDATYEDILCIVGLHGMRGVEELILRSSAPFDSWSHIMYLTVTQRQSCHQDAEELPDDHPNYIHQHETTVRMFLAPKDDFTCLRSSRGASITYLFIVLSSLDQPTVL